ncbi:MAG: DoxX family protein [Bacteroidales bacterium]
MKFVRNFSRIITALVFIFSGFVKAVDPMGTAYKFGDYFLAMNLEFLMDWAVPLAFLLIAAEFIIGWMLLFNVWTRVTSWFALGFMLLFTPVTLWLAVTNKVDDCGCFGDFLVMTNWETFVKNVVILVIVLILFFTRKKFSNPTKRWKQVIYTLAGILCVAYIQFYAYNHLAILDFRPFYKGAHIADNMLPVPEIAEITLVYKHRLTGEEMSFSPKTLPYQDSTLWPHLEWTRQEKKIIQPFQEAEAAFEIMGPEGKDHSPDIIGNKDFIFVLIMQDVSKANRKSFKKIVPLIEEANRRNIQVIAITGSMYDEVEAFLGEMGAPIPHYSADIIKLKTVIRANPGLLLLKNGYIIDKWHFNDIPDLKKLRVESAFDAFAPVQ